jgi:homoserine dehydrogenase
LRADLALIGFGNVGRRFVRLLDEQQQRLSSEFDLSYRVVGIATRRHGGVVDRDGVDVGAVLSLVEHGKTLASAGAEDLIAQLRRSDADMRVVVETTTLDIAAGQPAIDHIQAAIAAGCHAITANKGPVAFAYSELCRTARAAGVSFLFEGAVMDGIPIFNLVRETLPAVEITGFRGVINTTTNFIIAALEDGVDFAPALSRMQAEGIAEADPSLDLDGWDAAAKTAALANVLLGACITPHMVERHGIDEDTAPVVRAAVGRGHRLRLVATASRTPEGRITAKVGPMQLTPDDLLAGIRGRANALVLHTDLLGDVAICQLGGDVTQTAYALLTDLVTIRRRQAPPGVARGRTL